MRLAYVQSKVAKITEGASGVKHRDDEALHVQQDNLYIEVLMAIADGTCVDPQECAREALKIQGLDFSRWSA